MRMTRMDHGGHGPYLTYHIDPSIGHVLWPSKYGILNMMYVDHEKLSMINKKLFRGTHMLVVTDRRKGIACAMKHVPRTRRYL